jgi:sporulation protein YlmC with PRC-barrel domain
VFHRLRQFIGLRIEASDGEIGKISDIYFDDRSWAVRYLVIETGGWFAGRNVLISPLSVSRIDWDHHTIAIDLTRQRVESSPPIDTDRPVSRQHEADLCDYYGYPYYWFGPSLWGPTANPIVPVPLTRNTPGPLGESPLDLQLRSCVEVTGYALRATDSAIGHVEDFMLDPQTWAIRYLVVDTRHWLLGKHVVIPPQWIRKVDWAQRLLELDVSSASVKASPEFDPSGEFSPAHETNLYRHYQRHEDQMPAPVKCGLPPSPPADPAMREAMIRQAAYFMSQQRGPCLTHEAQDWLAAERQIDRMLTGHA